MTAVQSQWDLHDFQLRDLNRDESGARPPSKLRSLHDLLLSTEDDALDQSAVLVRGPAARDDLWKKLLSAKLNATGIMASGKREPIACTDWQDIHSFDPGRGWPFDAVGNGFKDQLKFEKVTVSSKEVLDLWPPIAREGPLFDPVREIPLQQAVQSAPVALEASTNQAKKHRQRIAESQIEPAFLQWRASQPNGQIPKYADAVAHMAKIGVGRDRVRELIRKLGGRKRGEKDR
ncbi:hypothetical protein [Bradyrhizobium sp. 2S1]|uniref:hypothetical protein n=1 Tax=Bradyrhizobium sp. 2S1 TaxID=1404429 RepID=UPI00140AE2AB|nr:hypothetical protein [Bradyrhizobium sp. 2S1]MCK7665234.1 hypothetical protein [Bradyrhizobium sp. 2S1]